MVVMGGSSRTCSCGWRLDRRELASAVAGFAPDVWVLDCDTGRRVTGDGHPPTP
jgi:hypothetical protein